MRVFIASDHAGLERKNKIRNFLASKNYELEDLGPDQLDQQDDYPDYAFALAKKVVASKGRGVLVCGNGQGVCIAANKVKGIRAASAFDPEMAKTTRVDDDANILCLPGRFLDDDKIESIVETWLETDFSEEPRHLRRIKKISDYEK